MKSFRNKLFLKLLTCVAIQVLALPSLHAQTAETPDGLNARALTTARVDAHTLSVRARPGTNYEVVEKLNEGDKIAVVAEVDGWLEILAPKGSEAWCAKQYIDETGRITGDQVRVRAGPGLVFSPYAELAEGTRVTPIGDVRNGWQQIEVPTGATVWVHGEFVTLIGEDNAASTLQAEPETVETPSQDVTEGLQEEIETKRNNAVEPVNQTIDEITESTEAIESRTHDVPVIKRISAGDEIKTDVEDDLAPQPDRAADEMDDAAGREPEKREALTPEVLVQSDSGTPVVRPISESELKEFSVTDDTMTVLTAPVMEAVPVEESVTIDGQAETEAETNLPAVRDPDDDLVEIGVETEAFRESVTEETAVATESATLDRDADKMVVESVQEDVGRQREIPDTPDVEVEALNTLGTLIPLGAKASAYATHVIVDKENGHVFPKCYLVSTRVNLREWENRRVHVHGEEVWYPGWSRPTIRVTSVQLQGTWYPQASMAE